MNQVINIINVLNYNPLVLNQMKNLMTQEMMMQNQMNMMKMMEQRMVINNSEDDKINEISTINIFFRYRDEPPVWIKGKPGDKVSEIIEKYRKESNDYDTTRKFIFNAKVLNESLTLVEGLTDNANIFVVVTQGVRGG